MLKHTTFQFTLDEKDFQYKEKKTINFHVAIYL